MSLLVPGLSLRSVHKTPVVLTHCLSSRSDGPSFSDPNADQVLFEVPRNIILKVWSPQMWFPTLTLVWGVVATLMGVTQSLAGFCVVRFFLGVAESGLFPGIVFYFSMWHVHLLEVRRRRKDSHSAPRSTSVFYM